MPFEWCTFSVMEHMIYKTELGKEKLETLLYYFTPLAQRLVDTCADCRALRCRSGEEHLLFHRILASWCDHGLYRLETCRAQYAKNT